MTTTRQAVARQQTERPTIAQFISQLTPEIQRALPKGMDGDRIARLALTLVRKDPALAQCSLESFAGALLTAAALGLEPGVNGEAYLVAYKQECTFIPGFMGLAKLYYQHPLARTLDAQAVRESDEFDYAYGLKPFLTHKPARGRGAITDYYACATLSTGAKAFVVLSPEECKALRGGKVGPDPRFKGGDPMHWMERKCCLRQLFKLLPKSATLSRALDADEKDGSDLYREQLAQSAPAPALEPPAGVDLATGEVVDGVAIEDPPDNPWPETARPPVPS